jgi:hypothetical protein
MLRFFLLGFLCFGIGVAANFNFISQNPQEKYHNREKIDRVLNFETGFDRTSRNFNLISRLSDPNPTPFLIPTNASTIKIGYVYTNVTNYSQQLFSDLGYFGVRTGEYITNSNGGIKIQDIQNYIEIIAYAGGPDCDNFLITIQYLILVDKVNFIIMPVNPGCPEIALLTETYSVPLLNPVDYSLSYLMAVEPTFANLSMVYSLTADVSTLGFGCLKSLFDKGARSYSLFYDLETGGVVVPLIKGSALNLGMKELVNETILSVEKQVQVDSKDNCSYVNPFIDQYIAADPDVLVGSFGATYTDLFVFCMHKKKYHPRALYLFTTSTFNGTDLWHTAGSFYTDFWVRDSNFTDPWLVSVPHYISVFNRLWGNGFNAQMSYAATVSTSFSILLSAIQKADSIDPVAVSAQFDQLNFLSVIGQIFPLSPLKIYSHPTYCCQRKNDTNPTGPAVYPFDTLGAVPAIYPYPFVYLPQFLQFLKSLKKGISRSTIAWISTVSVVGFLILVAIIIAGAVIFKWNVILIPKRENNGEW